MKHLIYKTTNNLNSRFYIGMHSTSNEDDGYLGSGKRIKAEIKKYGHDNFTREILFRELSRKELEDREAQVVNEELLADPLCLNLKNGGEGGGKFYSTQQLKNASIAGNKSPNRNHAILQSKRNTTLKMRGYINHSFHCDWSGKNIQMNLDRKCLPQPKENMMVKRIHSLVLVG
jgi:hypothetical protein